MIKRMIFVGLLLLGCIVVTQQQQCKLVSLCDPWGQNNSVQGESGSPQGETVAPSRDTENLANLVALLIKKLDQQEDALNQTNQKLDKLYNQLSLPSSPPPTLPPPPISCENSTIQGRQTLQSGEEVYCDDGWRVFQYRYDGSLSFNEDWATYQNGFGNLSSEFWMGLDKLHQVTNNGTSCRLRIDLKDFAGSQVYAEYSVFKVGDGRDGYRLSVSGYTGNATDSFTGSGIWAAKRGSSPDGMQFSTRDRDNDGYERQCAIRNGGAWWYNRCGWSRLNSQWSSTSQDLPTNTWYYWKNQYGGIQSSMMKVKCE